MTIIFMIYYIERQKRQDYGIIFFERIIKMKKAMKKQFWRCAWWLPC